MVAPSNKNAIALAWEFFKGNYALNFAALAILIVIYLLGMLPIIGLLFIMAYSILSLSIQVYFGKNVLRVSTPQEMGEIAQNTKIGELLTQWLQVAAGAFLAYFFIGIFFGILFSLLGGMSAAAMDPQNIDNMEAAVTSFGAIGLLLLIVAGFFFYFFPAVIGRVIKTEDFVAAFKTSFLIFSPTLWKSCFNKEYFVLILIWSLIVLGAVFLIGITAMTLILIPVAAVIMYLLSLYNAAIYVFADQLSVKE
ncbi:hypothetical protein [Nitratiruptor sp. YY09-18]|uniref:hypothetical protein n=1 Tax=Nitratiruptor sp. YY09-18 TaxID=2724901 RepID=UPI001915889A|nr:hypothetical protein [Nitratiruptor sp. YY09-18]BCD68289.1 hypothetical protein NitYY0918_C1200 [Nitratiruptor sp. YY09-18]